MTDKPVRLRRCQLAVPGSSEKMVNKATTLDVDHIFLDLEDAVAESEKDAARESVIAALNDLDWGNKSVCVRMNDLGTKHAYRDVIDVVERGGDRLDLIMIPKVKRAADVQWVDVLLSQIEARIGRKKKVGIEILIEEVEAMADIDAIAASSERLEAMIIGFGDYSAAQGIKIAEIDTYPGDIWHYARSRLIVACKVNGLDPIDGPYADIRNTEGYREDARRAMLLGCVGKWALHPDQVTISQDIFSPRQEEVDFARKVVAALREAQAKGLGASTVDGQMIDAASARVHERTLKMAEMLGM